MMPIPKHRPRRTVLVVEDALTNGAFLNSFSRARLRLCCTRAIRDSADAVLKSATVDAGILDLRLSDERSGLEVLEQLRFDDR